MVDSEALLWQPERVFFFYCLWSKSTVYTSSSDMTTRRPATRRRVKLEATADSAAREERVSVETLAVESEEDASTSTGKNLHVSSILAEM